MKKQEMSVSESADVARLKSVNRQVRRELKAEQNQVANLRRRMEEVAALQAGKVQPDSYEKKAKEVEILKARNQQQGEELRRQAELVLKLRDQMSTLSQVVDSLKAQQPGAVSEGEALSQDALQSEISVLRSSFLHMEAFLS